jgi:hypothetical protein
MKKFPFARFVPKRFRLDRIFGQGARKPPAPAEEEEMEDYIAYFPAWSPGHHFPFFVAKRRREFEPDRERKKD